MGFDDASAKVEARSAQHARFGWRVRRSRLGHSSRGAVSQQSSPLLSSGHSSMTKTEKACWSLHRQVIGVRETWLHPDVPALPDATVTAPAQQHDSTAETAADRKGAQEADTVTEHGPDTEPDVSTTGQLEQQLQAVALAEK